MPSPTPPNKTDGRLDTAYCHATPINPDDLNNLPELYTAIWVGATGTLTILTIDDVQVTFIGVPVGIFPVRAKKVLSTGTTCTGLVGLT